MSNPLGGFGTFLADALALPQKVVKAARKAGMPAIDAHWLVRRAAEKLGASPAVARTLGKRAEHAAYATDYVDRAMTAGEARAFAHEHMAWAEAQVAKPVAKAKAAARKPAKKARSNKNALEVSRRRRAA